MSLRRRLLLGLAVVAAVLVLTNVALSSTFRGYLVRRVDDELVETARRPNIARGPGSRGGPAPLSDTYFAVLDSQAATLTRFGAPLLDEDPPELDVAEVQGRASSSPGEGFDASSEGGGETWRLIAVPTADGRIAVIGQSLADVEDTLGRLRLVQGVGTVAVLAALGVVAWWVLRLGVRPIVAMAGTADEIAAGDLSRRVEHVNDRTEAGRLGVAFNSMLGEIEEAFRQREASEARVRRFAADASHELRTPLTSIRGYAELWQAGGLRDEGQLDEAMRRMAQEGRRMGALVEDLLELARLDQDRPIERAPVRLDLLVGDGVADAAAVEPDRPITVTASEAVVVEGDELRLRQIVANLLTNARVHTPAGTPVSVSLATVGEGLVRLEVADEGPGMPPEVVERVFERFYRADSSRVRASGGSGLGLSIVAAVAAAHGGRAWATSEEGAGSRFLVELPSSQEPPSRLPGDVEGTGRS
jgi:two-component system, OmpR family, sensor kinase